MERVIKLSELRKAVEKAYEDNKSIKDGEVDPRLKGLVDENEFGISVALADGTMINKADSDALSPIGDILKVPVATILLSQNPIDEIMKKSGMCACCCSKADKPQVPVSPRGVRAVSLIQPEGDPESKWNFIENQMIGLMGSAPQLNDKLYEKMKADNKEADVVNAFAKANYYLFDDAAVAVDLYTRGSAMMASTKQLAMMGATIAADGVNPVSNEIVFDGSLSQRVVAMMAAKGPHKMSRPWLIVSGLPAKSSFGGAIMGVLPGVMSIAAYSPKLNEKGVSVKAAKAIIEIMNSLGISVFSSACLKIENDEK